MSLEQEVELIRQFPIFAKIQPAMQKLLCFSAERLNYDAGQVMFNAGDMGDAAYIVIDGKVEISVPTPSGPIVVNTLGRNDIIGEIAIFGDVPRTATATAQDRVETLKISKELFDEDHPREPRRRDRADPGPRRPPRQHHRAALAHAERHPALNQGQTTIPGRLVKGAVSRRRAGGWKGEIGPSGRSVNHSDRHGVIRGIQRGTAARNASYSLPNVCSSVGSSYATTWTWKASHNSAP